MFRLLIILSIFLTISIPATIAQDDEHPACSHELVQLYADTTSDVINAYVDEFNTILDKTPAQAGQAYVDSHSLTMDYIHIQSQLPECLVPMNMILIEMLTEYTYVIGLASIAQYDDTNIDIYIEEITLSNENLVELNEAINDLTDEVISALE